MALSQPARLKTWLGQTGLRQTNFPLYQLLEQLINSLIQDQKVFAAEIASGGGGGSPNAITGLNTDVVATGPGNVPATIQPNVVTYAKIQQVSALRLVGNPDGSAQDMVEIPIADGLAFVNGALVVEVVPGVPGLLHRLLSATHFDTRPAPPTYGDLVRAGEGVDFEGQYYGFTLNAPIVEDFQGIQFGYYSGYHGILTPSISMGYSAPNNTFIPVTPPNTWLAWEYIDFFLLSLLIEDFEGIRWGYEVRELVGGNNFGYYPPELSFIQPPSPENEETPALWERLPIGSEGDVLTVVDGIPEWQSLPAPPPLGDESWVDIAFDAGDFSAAGGTSPDWTVAEANIERWQYQFQYNSSGIPVAVRYALYVRATTVSGSAPTQLLVTIPHIIIGRYAEFISIQENNTAVNDAFVEYDEGVSTTTLFINKVAGATFDTTAGETYVAFEISAALAP